ncbi:cell wall-binding repeat-containing protein [Fictibacillus nanhaiensis]|uniref:Cell wall-binding repeat-containing protein n=1 Tax=Fictibacillus nanhaiensis TaxID=742169 RepID=A0ABS2ZMT0_9BACL|nr:cell wall-binding repeat-containing protein [Fictibacillus nanhaiensis]
MKRITASAFSVSLAASLLFTTGVSANTSENNPFSTNKREFHQNNHLAQSAVQTTVTYKQRIDMHSIHEYYFESAGGQFKISKFHSEEDINVTLTNMSTQEEIEFEYDQPFNLPHGEYIFIIQGDSELSQGYEYEFYGIYKEQPSVLLPSLTISNPSSQSLRLAKGNTHIDVTGTTDANELAFYLNNEEPISLGKSFNTAVSLKAGYNSLTFSALNTDSNNAVLSLYNVISPGIKRIGGKDRFEVSAGISKEVEDQGVYSDTIIITRGDLYTDALSGGPLAALEDSPILLTGTHALPNKTLDEIIRRSPEKAIILGGTGSVSTKVENQLRSLGVQTIQRIAGKDRFEVSASVAKQLAEYTDTAIIASGLNFPDALSASSMAGYAGMPILLVRTSTVPDSIQAFIKDNPDINNFIIVGGPATVSDSVKTKIKQLRSDAFVDRIGGLNRYQVSINTANYGIENYGMDLSSLVVARGDVFADALSGSPLASFTGAPILLTTSTKVENNIINYLKQKQGETDLIYILGGTGSIATTTEQQLSSFIK